ncbi:MAG: hypothetical protein A3G76_04105 [Acidobacteria bacterium RIFCSPLOWO2_12_FULL_65_11]|nr:MAG: hypothetical protein A3H95_15880 [Acidobacteria bacterium RIFCSPLOWO2_02_FULL_64_15]OFW32758.1 MAG: hypothetical protein A3G76_04105 [Acidobacteria bacterium RIFCSPLOWO2_12_FULL_65_11]
MCVDPGGLDVLREELRRAPDRLGVGSDVVPELGMPLIDQHVPLEAGGHKGRHEQQERPSLVVPSGSCA